MRGWARRIRNWTLRSLPPQHSTPPRPEQVTLGCGPASCTRAGPSGSPRPAPRAPLQTPKGPSGSASRRSTEAWTWCSRSRPSRTPPRVTKDPLWACPGIPKAVTATLYPAAMGTPLATKASAGPRKGPLPPPAGPRGPPKRPHGPPRGPAGGSRTPRHQNGPRRPCPTRACGARRWTAPGKARRDDLHSLRAAPEEGGAGPWARAPSTHRRARWPPTHHRPRLVWRKRGPRPGPHPLLTHTTIKGLPTAPPSRPRLTHGTPNRLLGGPLSQPRLTEGLPWPRPSSSRAGATHAVGCWAMPREVWMGSRALGAFSQVKRPRPVPTGMLLRPEVCVTGTIPQRPSGRTRLGPRSAYGRPKEGLRDWRLWRIGGEGACSPWGSAPQGGLVPWRSVRGEAWSRH
eukprot:jgi/Botrbrau1/22169/Bobra.168_1s0001.1